MLQSTQIRIPVLLVNVMGVPVTGVLPVDVLNSSAQIIKSDGSTQLIPLVLNTNWFEISAQSPGLYHILVPASATSILGPIQMTLYPSASAFDEVLVKESVIADTEGLIYQYLFGNQSLDANLDRLTIYKADGITPLVQYYLTDKNGKPSIFNVYNKKVV